jgi:simple sugar transport system substrate-binding protein
MSAAGGTEDVLDIPLADSTSAPAVTGDIHAFLLSHPQIDGIDTIGSAIAVDALGAVKAAAKTGSVKVGTDDISTAVLNDIKTGALAWDIDQQPYLQGFLPILFAYQTVRYGLHPTQPVITGGLIVNKSNVDSVLAVQQQYKGLRGAQ